MKKEIVRKWIKALRSGRYRQTRWNLRKKVFSSKCSYCAYGVLYALYFQEKKKKWDIRHQAKILDWAGIENFDSRLTTANDFFKKSFSELADIIERKYL